MQLYGPDRLLQAYFCLRARLASCAGIALDGMPSQPTNVGAAAHKHARLCGLVWFVQDLTADELEVLAARVLGAAGVAPVYRYLVSAADMQPDEVATGGHHPGDPRCKEVRSMQVRQPTYKELADWLGRSHREIARLVREGRGKVGRRMRERPRAVHELLSREEEV